jgi:hypothetical protein
MESYDNLRNFFNFSNLDSVYEFLNNFINGVFDYETILRSFESSEETKLKFDKKLVSK